MTPTPIESNLQRSPAHAPHIRGMKGSRTRRIGDVHADRVELAALPHARPINPWRESPCGGSAGRPRPSMFSSASSEIKNDGLFSFFVFQLKVQKNESAVITASKQASKQASKIWTPIHYRKYSRVYLRTDLQLLAKKTPTAGGWIFRDPDAPRGGV